MLWSRASARHSVRTGQPTHTAFARFCAAPWTNSVSGSVTRHAARVVQSLIQAMCRKVRNKTYGATGPNGSIPTSPYGLYTEPRRPHSTSSVTPVTGSATAGPGVCGVNPPRSGRTVDRMARPQPGGIVGASVRIALFLVVSVLSGLLVAGLLLPLVGSAGAAVKTVSQDFENLPSILRQPVLPQQTKIYTADGKLLATIYGENRIVVPL